MPKQFLDLNGLGVYHTNISSYIDSKSVELTQDEYDDLVDEGGVDPDVTYYISDGVVPGSPVTDVKMNNVSIVSNHVANIPLVSSSTNGLVPQGTSVTTQSQSTKFLREDGSWQAPSYTSVSDRALIDGSNIGDKATFRENIGLGYSVSTQTYDGLTWTIIKLGNLYDLYTEITIPADTNAITWGSIYVYRNPNKSYYALPIALTKKIVDVSCMDGNSDGFPVFYTNISSVYNSVTTADVGHPTTTTKALTVRKYIRGYVS